MTYSILSLVHDYIREEDIEKKGGPVRSSKFQGVSIFGSQSQTRNFIFERKMVYGGALSRFSFGLATFLLFTFVLGKEKCSKTCIAKNCNIVGVRYGKYCGIGYFGCPGEKPCDGLDACCMTHDNCVDLKGMTYVNCHKQFQHCVNRLSRAIKQSNGTKVGFSTKCPYSKVIPTVYNGMDYGIFFSKIGNIFKPRVSGKAPRVEVNLARSKADTKDGLGIKVAIQRKEGSKVTASLNQR